MVRIIILRCVTNFATLNFIHLCVGINNVDFRTGSVLKLSFVQIILRAEFNQACHHLIMTVFKTGI